MNAQTKKLLSYLLLAIGIVTSCITGVYYSRALYWKDAVHIHTAVFSKNDVSYNGEPSHYIIRMMMHDHTELPGLFIDYGDNPYLEVEVNSEQFENYRKGYAIDIAYRTSAPRETILEEDLTEAVPRILLLIISLTLLISGAILLIRRQAPSE